jgi:PAS domain S-box-containing protein
MLSKLRNPQEENASQQRWQALFSVLFNGTSDSVFLVDPSGQLADANPRFCELIGHSHAEILGLLITDLFPGDNLHWDTTRPDQAQLKKRGVSLRCRRGATYQILESSLTVFALPDGSRLGLVAAAAEQPADMQALLAKQACVDRAPIAILRLGQAGQVLEVNDQACQDLGYTRAELLQLTIFDFDPTVTLEKWRKHRGSVTAQGTQTVETTHRRKDGTTHPVEVTVNNFQLQGRDFAFSFAQDITLRKTTEAALKESALRFRQLAEATFEGIAVTYQGKFVDMNDQFAHMMGYSREELLQEPVSRCVAPEHRELVSEYMRSGRLETYEHLALRKDGTKFTVEIRARTTRFGDQEVRVSAIRDMTERKRLEKETEQRRLFLESILASTPDAIVTADFQHRILEWNPGAEALFGYTAAEAHGQHIDDLIAGGDPAIRAEAARWTQHIQISAGRFSGETIRYRKDGLPVNVQVSVAPLIDRGPWSGAVAVYHDITERKTMESALRQSEFFLRKSQAVSQTGSYYFDARTGHWISSPALDQLFGIDDGYPKDVQGWGDLIHPDEREEMLRYLTQEVLAKHHRFDREYRILRHDNQQARWVHGVGELEFDDQGYVTKMIGTLQDITARKLAEEAVRQSEERFRTLFMSMNEGFYLSEVIYDTEGNPCDYRYLEVNPKFEQILGLSRDQIIGKRYKEIVPIDTTQWMHTYSQVARTGHPLSYYFYSPEYRRHFETSVYRSTHGQVTVMITDITERKEAELLIQAQKEQLIAQNEELTAQNEELIGQGRALEAAENSLRQINEELEARIGARSAELYTTNHELQLANAALLRVGRMKDEFLANMSHELRTPLTAILGYAELLDKGFYGDLTEEQRHTLRTMQGSAEHLLQLINDILDLSKVEAGKMELHLSPVLVEEICQAGLQFIQQVAHKKNIQLSSRLDPQVHHVLADGRRLKQMLINLLNNAVKFTPEGGQVGLEVMRSGDDQQSTHHQVLFVVWDNGIGIPQEKQSLLFRPFVQLDGSLSRKYEGTGLGLALVAAMAELHGGSISVQSAGPGQGSRFTLALPGTTESPLHSSTDAAEAAGFVSLAGALGRPPVILAVDDSALTLSVLSKYLEAMGCKVIIARDGTEALLILENPLQAPQPDLVLLDIQMPGIDGLTVIRRLRAAGSRVPIVALTALAMPGDRELCLEAGATDYLSKPVKLDKLAHVLGQLLRKEAA